MLKRLLLENVGPAPRMELDLGSRLNILTGDNGLGKSFLLDVAWFVNTGCWPFQVNSKLLSGRVAVPSDPSSNQIAYVNDSTNGSISSYSFQSENRGWSRARGTENPKTSNSLTVYMMPDGSCAIFDPHKNESLPWAALKPRELPAAFVFDNHQIWYGLDSDQKRLCNGLIADWANWQNNGGEAFLTLVRVLEILSPSDSEIITPGPLTRMGIDDARDYPSIRVPQIGEIPVLHASSGIRRVLSFAYVIVWAWLEHKKAASYLKKETSNNVLVLLDEVDAHLHPRWQRGILPALLGITEIFGKEINIQLIATTHSPLVMASLEPHFDEARDAWFDLDLVPENGVKPHVELTKRDFTKYGNAESWLHSRAFDLTSTRSLEGEALLKEAKKMMKQPSPPEDLRRAMHQRLVDELDSRDEFLDYWRLFWHRKNPEA